MATAEEKIRMNFVNEESELFTVTCALINEKFNYWHT